MITPTTLSFENRTYIGERKGIDMEAIDYEGLLFIDSGDNYMPLKCLFSEAEKTRGTAAVMGHYLDYKHQKFKDEMYNNARHLYEMAFKKRHTSGSAWTPLSFKHIISNISEGLKAYLDSSIDMYMPFKSPDGRFNRTSYDNISASFVADYNKAYYLQSMKRLVSGRGMIYHSHESEILMTLVFKSSLTRYQKLHYILYGRFDVTAMEFWINDDIDRPQYAHQGFRKMYRNSIKPRILEAGIPIITKSNINKALAATFHVPQSSIAELAEWKTNLLHSVLEEEKDGMTFSF